MVSLIVDAVGAVAAVVLVGCLVRGYLRKLGANNRADQIPFEDYLQKITHLTGRSAYDIFHISAEEWHVPADRIDQDFKRYLNSLTVPYYVKDFIRKGQKHIDELFRGRGGYFADKRLVVFYTLLVLLFWGGAVFLSLYVFPHILPGDIHNLHNLNGIGPP